MPKIVKKRMLMVADFACATGFAQVSQNVAKHLYNKWDIDVLALNYYGDPHPLQRQFNLFPAALNGDVYGINRIGAMVEHLNYDVVFVINDIWVINEYLKRLSGLKKKTPVVFYTPVDAKHLKPDFIKPLNEHAAHGVFYTNFGLGEAQEAGINIPTSVIPHGVDSSIFYPTPQKIARKETGLPEDWFIVLMLDRNQPRKRLDLGLYFFSEWCKRTDKPENVKIYYHGALRDAGIDIEDYAAYLKIDNRLVVTSREMTMQNMLPVDKLRLIHASSDIFFKPCTSEGWGLSLHEAMACGIPAIVPRSSALAEWPNNHVQYIEVLEGYPNVNTAGVNTIFDTPDIESFIHGMEELYRNPDYRKKLGWNAHLYATSNRFQWKTIAAQFDRIFEGIGK